MATPYPNKISMAEASTYQQAMLGMNAIVIARPGENGYVMVQPQQLTRVATQPGQHYKVRQLGSDAKTLQTPDNVVAVRHADALHLRYADGSTASFDGFYAVCTDSSVCSVNLASDDAAGMTLDGANASGGVGDDGMMVYAHGNRDTLMAMAQDQSSMLSALRALDEMPVITYLPPGIHLGSMALLALGIAAATGANQTNGNGAAAPGGASSGTAKSMALNAISAAAEGNTAGSSALAASVYANAEVTGVTSTNLTAINSALDSAPVNGIAADTTPEVQAIVDAYSAILASADGVGGNSTTPLTGAQYSAIGVTGVSGTATPGSALYLLNNTVDAIPTAGVDTVAEVQFLADAAARVMAAAGGTSTQASAVTLTDLTALGIVGVTAGNLAAVQTAIQNTAPDSAIDTQAELQAIANAATNASQGTNPSLSSTLGSVSNLEVSSNIVFSVNQSVIVGTGLIHITDLGGAGYQGDSATNSQTIDVATAVANGLLTISGTGTNTKIIINPLWDLDLASNYQITIDDGAFQSTSGSLAAVHLAPVSFSTVTPGTHVAGTVATEAVASQTMVDATGALAAGKSWLDIQGIGNNTASVAQLGDLSGGSYALVMKNYATVRGGDTLTGGDGSDGIATHDTNVGVVNFGNNDIVYFDSQVNNTAIQFFDARYTSATDGASIGGLTGQNAMVMGLVPTPAQQGSTAMILLGLEGNSADTIYPGVITLSATTIGWANVWHAASPAVIMG
jgi:uncharacterized protein YdbL (DUF1318 family)